LLHAGHKFKSDTDTEVLAHLIGDYYEKRCSRRCESADGPRFDKRGCKTNGNDLTQAVCDALREVIGTYGLAVICADEPDTIVGARRGSPLIIGIGAGENFLASDANAIVAHTKKVVYLNDYDVATITPERFDVLNLGTDTANVQISKLEFSQEDACAANTRTSCSRKFTNSRAPWKTPCAAAWTTRARPPSSAA